MPISTTAPIACFGEVLWDILPNGKHVGGAPFNVCYHLNQLGLHAGMISSVGNDEDGIAIRQELQQKKMSMDFLQESTKPTGTVTGQPSSNAEMVYTITEEVAWDDIRLTESTSQLVQAAPCFIFGSLAARSETSRTTLFQLLDLTNCAVFDVNLRAPFYSPELIRRLLNKTSILKINENELNQLTNWFGQPGTIAEELEQLAERFFIEEIVLTRGANGSLIYKEKQSWIREGITAKIADTVGSGDAYLAGYLYARFQGYDTPQQAVTANTLAAWVTQSFGACPPYDASILASINHLRNIKPELQ